MLARIELEVAGYQCPRCAGYATREPGGGRCIGCGYCWLHRQVLPRDHPLSGRDYANRQRQLALDRMFTHPGRAREIVQELLERLEPRA